MAFVTGSNFVADLAWWIGFSFSMLAILCIFWMLWLRKLTHVARERAELLEYDFESLLYKKIENRKPIAFNFWKLSIDKNSRKKWQLSTFENQDGENGKFLESLIKQDILYFLFRWNYLHDSLRGESKQKLNELDTSLNLSEKCLTLLKSRNLEKKLLAIETLGNLGKKSAWNALKEYVDAGDSIVSLKTVTALCRIDQDAAIEEFLPMIAKREDWSPIFVAKLLRELSSDVISKPITEIVRQSYLNHISERQLSRIISYLALAHTYDYSLLIQQILNETNHQEILLSCLRLTEAEEVLPRVRQLAKDDRWQVRMQVMLTLGRLGVKEDTEFLIKALNDIEWWVRYRAACALTASLHISLDDLTELSNTLPNEFARDILKQVLAEIRLKCLTQPSSFTLSR